MLARRHRDGVGGAGHPQVRREPRRAPGERGTQVVSQRTRLHGVLGPLLRVGDGGGAAGGVWREAKREEEHFDAGARVARGGGGGARRARARGLGVARDGLHAPRGGRRGRGDHRARGRLGRLGGEAALPAPRRRNCFVAQGGKKCKDGRKGNQEGNSARQVRSARRAAKEGRARGGFRGPRAAAGDAQLTTSGRSYRGRVYVMYA
mmetsp:Transcript_15742/g.66313  ORF Transcript_15742/g.66313 Transcript_15742/m.66313 type:complete len:206 (+) Transcript_15742:1596-2213(+)